MKVFIAIVMFLVIGAVAIYVAADPAPITAEGSTMSKITWQKLADNMNTGSLLVDVRTTEEFNQGHIEGATLLPLLSIQSGTIPSQDKSKPLYVYCRSGNRSAEAKQILERSGFTNVIDLGAMSDVVSLGGKQIR